MPDHDETQSAPPEQVERSETTETETTERRTPVADPSEEAGK